MSPSLLDPELITRYARKGILVDSSLLVVYLVGLFDRRQLVNCRAIKSSFSNAEFDLLANLLACFDAVVTTPHVLTEVFKSCGSPAGSNASKIPGIFRASDENAHRAFDFFPRYCRGRSICKVWHYGHGFDPSSLPANSSFSPRSLRYSTI